MAKSLAEIMQGKTVQQITADMIAYGQSLGLNVTAWQTLGIARTILAIMARVAWGVYVLAQFVAAGGYLGTAAGDYLTLLSLCYGVVREGATAATGTVTVTNDSTVVYGTIPAGSMRFANGQTAATYINTRDFDLLASGSVDVAIASESPGSIQGATPGQVSVLVNPLPGVSCTNSAAIVGTDTDSDDSLRQRCRDSLAAPSVFGPSAAYDLACRDATYDAGIPIVKIPCGVTRALVISLNGDTVIYVAGDSGAIAGDTSDPTTPLGGVMRAIKLEAKPQTSACLLYSAAPVAQNIVGTYVVREGVTVDGAWVNAVALATLQNDWPQIPIGAVGGSLIYRNQIESAIMSAMPLQLQTVQISTPAGNVSLSVGQVSMLGAVTLTEA